VQCAHHVGGAGGDEELGGHAKAGVVVDDVEDLIDHAVRHFDVGHVGLPALVGELGHEALPRALGSLVRFGRDEAPGDEDPVDGRDRGDLAPRGGHVEVDGLGARIEAALSELLSDPDDLVLVEVGDARRRGLGSPRARFEPRWTLEAVTAQQLEEPALAHPVGRGQLLDGPARPQVRLDQEPALVHGRPLPVRTLLCLDTGPGQELSYVLEADTVGAALCR
jgi:hypothetical protein